MFAVLALVAFAVALILHLAGAGRFVFDAELAGFICLAASHLWAGAPWRRPPA